MRIRSVASVAFISTSFYFAGTCDAQSVAVPFELLSQASVAGHKPSAAMPVQGDWLIGTPDDEVLPAGFNPQGAYSHNFADLTGVGGAGFNMAPSLTGQILLNLTPGTADTWQVQVTGLQYLGIAMPTTQMNQVLVTPGSPATQNPAMNVDGLGNSGTWQASEAGAWAIQYSLDFAFATNADEDPDPADLDATFNDKLQLGYLLPVSALTPAGLAQVALDDPAGFLAGDFETYLLNVIAPLLPQDATYLLVTQMAKTHPDYTEVGLPVTTASLIGNTTIAYTTTVIPEPTSVMVLGMTVLGLIGRRFAIRERSGRP